MAHYANDKTDKAGSKRENLDELVTAAKQYVHEEDSEMNETQGFIALATLDSSGESNQSSQESRSVNDRSFCKRIRIPCCLFSWLGGGLIPFKAE